VDTEAYAVMNDFRNESSKISPKLTQRLIAKFQKALQSARSAEEAGKGLIKEMLP
jgi:ABC-type nitrate/sulfonate/bicarbonate transport system substrate-binding protein